MVDQYGREINTAFKGLATTVAIMGGVGGACLIGFETLRQMKRLPRRQMVEFWKEGPAGNHAAIGQDRVGVGVGDRCKDTQEDWEMGHLYHARVFHATTPSPPLARWPLAWAWQALRLDDWFYATHCGMDTTVYVRFLRGCAWWMFLQFCTTAPILLAIHFKFSRGVPLTDMSRASLSYLVQFPDLSDPRCATPTSSECPRVPNEQGRSLLWIHLCLTWWLTATWFFTLWWIGKGSLQIRRKLIAKVKADRETGNAEAAARARKEAELAAIDDERSGMPLRRAHALSLEADNSEGWRQRTLLVTNLPATMRDEASIRRYFEEFLRPDDDASHEVQQSQQGSVVELRPSQSQDGGTARTSPTAPGPSSDSKAQRNMRSPVQTVVVVRKMNELSAMLSRRQEILQQLEAAHVKLAQTVMGKVAHRKGKLLHPRKPWYKFGRPVKAEQGSSPASEEATSNGKETHAEKKSIDELVQRLGRFLPSDLPANDESTARLNSDHGDVKSVQSFWEELSNCPRELLDPYQPVTSLSALFRGQKVPTIDYLLTKLNLLTALVAEMRARPPTEYEATSTAFVTLRDPRQARMVWRELSAQIVIKVRMAPEVKDLDWERLMRTSFTSDLVRGVGVNAFFWGFTIFWLIPLQLVATVLFSVSNLKKVFPPVDIFFQTHQQLESFVSVTLPTVIVSLVTMAIPELIFQISKRAQGFVTWSILYDECLCRYWKFIICNVLIFFCIGTTTIESILKRIGNSSSNDAILNDISSSFPTAAPFFVSYLILGMGLHNGFELLGFMVPILTHFLGANKATTPRARALKTLPRNFNRYYWLPFHTLIMTIVFVFAILNPLVIPFAMLYLMVAQATFKKNFAFVYYRRFMEKEGVIYFIRLFRFSLDGLTTAQVVILIFFSVTDQQKAYIALTAILIPITVVFKVLGTRLWKSQCRAVEDEEANVLCDIDSGQQLAGHHGDPEDPALIRGASIDSGTPLDARASGRFPTTIISPASRSPVLRIWQRLHDSFNANGADKPSYMAVRAAKGDPVQHPVIATVGAVAKQPFEAAKSQGKKTRRFGHAAKVHMSVDKAGKAETAANVRAKEQEKDLQSLSVSKRANLGALNDERLKSIQRRGDAGRGSAAGESTGMVRSVSNSTRTPFLSGFEALTNHAPVPSEGGIEDFEDGEDSVVSVSQLLPRRNASMASRSRSMRRAAATGSRRGRDPARATAVSADAVPYSSMTIRRILPSGLSELTIPTSASGLAAVGEASGSSDEESPNGYGDRHHNEDDEGDEDDEDEDDSSLNSEKLPLVRPHAQIRWDDTPNNVVRYNNPFYSCELDAFLWLPRNPVTPLDLCDTIEWHGNAFVSSDGGTGAVGEWEEEEDEDEVGADGDIDDNVTSVSRIVDIGGQEEIVLGSILAKRLQTEENVEKAADPAASLSKKVLGDYKRAIRRNSVSQASHDGIEYTGGDVMRPHSSNMSASSIRSPAPSERLERDERFAHERDLSGSSLPPLLATDGQPSSAPVDSGAESVAVAQGASTVPYSSEARKTHFAPDPERLRVSSAQGQYDQPPSPVRGFRAHQQEGSGLSHGSLRRNQRAANTSIGGGNAPSIRSVTTQGQRTVTMRQALQAEVLEEERRRSIRDRINARRKLTSKTMIRANSQRKAEADAIEEEASRSGDVHAENQESDALSRRDTIMSRHERALGRSNSRHLSAFEGATDNGSAAELGIHPSREASLPASSSSMQRIASMLRFQRSPREDLEQQPQQMTWTGRPTQHPEIGRRRSSLRRGGRHRKRNEAADGSDGEAQDQQTVEARDHATGQASSAVEMTTLAPRPVSPLATERRS